MIVAACNEQATIQRAIEKLLQQDYPDLQIVLVDDRSTDRTGAIIDELAARDSRITPIHIDALPDGWLGKVHALHRGTQEATGEWLLLCDADVHLSAGCLKRAVSLAVAQRLDHLPVLPHIIASKCVLNVTTTAFAFALTSSLKAHKFAKEDSDVYAGCGAFNLVRADALRRSRGLQWLRMEVAEDLGVGLLMRLAGHRTGIAVSRRSVSIEWYTSVREMIRGLEKNTFAVFGRFSLARTFANVIGFAAVGLSPVVGLLAPLWTKMWILTVIAIALLFVLSRVGRRGLGLRTLPALAQPLGIVLIGYAIVRSALRCSLRGGIMWRSTFYPLHALRQGQRVKL